MPPIVMASLLQPAGGPSLTFVVDDHRAQRRLIVAFLLSILLHLVLLSLFRVEWWQPPLPPEEEWFEVVPVPASPAKRLPIVETPEAPESPPPVKPEALAERSLRKAGTDKPTASPLEGEVETSPLAPKPPAAATAPGPAPLPKPTPPKMERAETAPQTPPVKREGDLLPSPTRSAPGKEAAKPPAAAEERAPPAPTPSPPRTTRRPPDLVPSWESEVYAPYTAPRAGAPGLAYPGRRAIPLDTADDRFISYFLSIKRQIEYIWDYPQRAAERGEHGDCIIQFTILKDGRVREIRLLRSSGFRDLDDEALNAVADGAPYNPIPKRLATDELVVTGTFRYVLHRLQPFVR
ncbi:MAG: energy transducer TonB [Nitrospirota bacterium]|jgi:protein TonB